LWRWQDVFGQRLGGLDTTVTGGKVIINMSGPSDVWFGVGFDARAMADRPYVVVVDGHGVVSEHKIGDHEPGTTLNPTQVTVVSSTVVNGVRTVVLSRAFKGVTADHYTFDPDITNFPFINAVGNTPDFSFHRNKATSTITFTALDTATCICNNGFHAYVNNLQFGRYCAPEPTGDLVQQKNPTCWIQTYSGGLYCCHHKAILLDEDQPVDTRVDEVYLKFRFYYQDYQPPTPSNPKPSHLNLKRFYFMTEAYAGEYDIIPCPAGTPSQDCIQEITARWKVRDMFYDCNPEKDAYCNGTGKGIKLIYAGGHCHAPSCLSIELYNLDTGSLLCRQTPVWGTGVAEKFDEAGYLLIPPCLWGDEEGLVPPELLTLDTYLLSVKRNNNTYGHYGEMASWQMRGIVL